MTGEGEGGCGVVCCRDEEAVEGFMEALATCGLEDQLTSGIGFALHLTDVWAPALAAKEVSGCSAETLSVLLEPFVHCMAFHSNATVLTRVQQEVLPGGLPELVESPHVGAAKVHEVRKKASHTDFGSFTSRSRAFSLPRACTVRPTAVLFTRHILSDDDGSR